MIVVADASPIIVLVNIDRIEILPALFTNVIVPLEVFAELARPHPLKAVNDFVRGRPSWLLSRFPSAIVPLPDLDPGERAAISLADELKADLLLIDERLGRERALERRLRITGTVGVMILAAERELLNLEDAFERVKKTDF